MVRLRQPVRVATVMGLVVAGAMSAVGAQAAPAPVAGTSTTIAGADPVDRAEAIEIALADVKGHPGRYRLTAGDVADLAVAGAYVSEDSGVTHVTLSQRKRGLEVFGAYATVNVASDGEVLFVGESLVGGLADSSGRADLGAAEAARSASERLDVGSPRGVRVTSQPRGQARKTVLSGGEVSEDPIPARLGWQPTADGLRMAWQLVLDDPDNASLWNTAVDAETGGVLKVEDWTSHDTMTDLSHRLGRSARTATTAAGSIEGSPDPVEDGATYRVVTRESPSEGPRTLVSNPADATASPHGWHDLDGAPGAEHTTTAGNNVTAYLDENGDDRPDSERAVDGGDDLTFDADADLDGHAQNYRDAAVTNLFYWNNIVHDVAYGYGFDEAAGNFSANTYGRGGAGGDAVLAEAADGGGIDNANFASPAVDGSQQPRMQMYLWPGDQFGAQNQVVVDGVGSFDASWSRFAPAPTAEGTRAGTLVHGGTGCDAGQYPSTLPSQPWTAVVDSGSDPESMCTFQQRGQVAQELGAAAVVVAVASEDLVVVDGPLSGPSVEIPMVSVTRTDGDAIEAATGEVAVTVRQHPDHPGIRDGDLDAGIIIHEYAHGISTRLTGGPTVNCLGGDEQAGEGWSDFLAMAMLLDPAVDDPDGPRGMGSYVTYGADRHSAGIRPAPYSRDMRIQPFTYDSIKTKGWIDGTTLKAPHGIGHGWAAVLWDMTWDLIDKHGFNPDVYDEWSTGGNNRAIQYVIDGLKFQGCYPGLLDSRDGIIAAADELSDGEDTCTIWNAFARRGLGYSATQGSSFDRDDNREAFDTHPDCRTGFEGLAAEPALNLATAGSALSAEFVLGGDKGLDVLAGTPYSRQVNCRTLAVEDPRAEQITPRPLPEKTVPAGNGLSYDETTGRYTYGWKTMKEWGRTCRELVVTRADGVQHRAFFEFAAQGAAHPVSGHVRDADGAAVANATVRIDATNVAPVTTDAEGAYTFASVPKGTHTATAVAAGGCSDPLSQQVSVDKPTTLDFSLPRCKLRRVSMAADGTEGNRDSSGPSVSSDGRYVAFYSPSSVLVPGDGNGTRDVFVTDRTTGEVERVSVASDGTEGNGTSTLVSLSADGRYAAYDSLASNLVAGDGNDTTDIFLRDREAGTTERVSVASDGTEGNAHSDRPVVSADGRYVAFDSSASNLVPGDVNGLPDVFVHDRVTGTTELVSATVSGAGADSLSYAASISADGRFVAYYSSATNLVAGDTNRAQDVFVRDRQTGTTERVSLGNGGVQSNGNSMFPSLSSDGRFVVFHSIASNLAPGDNNRTSDVFLHDRRSRTTERVSVSGDGTEGDGFSGQASVSADGRRVVFESLAANLVAGDTNDRRDVFVHDRSDGTTELLSAAGDGTLGDATSDMVEISADGRYAAFRSYAANLVRDDTNDLADIFLRELGG
ncbi:M36 family metallopeptidase [Nocardioides sp. CCNWLW239]|uniref:M36 family metallopeptidase n=1 Tax=Nocardioides sp. CCNWLW239 TaxID=3128902 RepID=UPI00301AB03A